MSGKKIFEMLQNSLEVKKRKCFSSLFFLKKYIYSACVSMYGLSGESQMFRSTKPKKTGSTIRTHILFCRACSLTCCRHESTLTTLKHGPGPCQSLGVKMQTFKKLPLTVFASREGNGKIQSICYVPLKQEHTLLHRRPAA